MDKKKYYNHDPRTDGYNNAQISNPEYENIRAPQMTNHMQVQPKENTVQVMNHNHPTDNTSQIPPSNAISQIALRAPQKSTDSRKQLQSASKPEIKMTFMDSDDDDYLDNVSRPQTPPELKGFDQIYQVKNNKPGTTNNVIQEGQNNIHEQIDEQIASPKSDKINLDQIIQKQPSVPQQPPIQTHPVRRAIVDDEQSKANSTMNKKKEQKESDSSDDSSFDSSSSSNDSQKNEDGKPMTLEMKKKRLEKERLKKIQALKQELERRSSLKNASTEEKAEFLKKSLAKDHVIKKTIKEEKKTIEAPVPKRPKQEQIKKKIVGEKRGPADQSITKKVVKKPDHNRPEIIATKPKKIPVAKSSVKKSTPQMNLTEALAPEDINFNYQSHLVEEFAPRWSYALPAYPPQDYDYSSALKSKSLTVVTLVEFQKYKNQETKKNSKQVHYVYQIENFEGVFRDHDGKNHDLRPEEGRPSLKTFTEFEKKKLQELLLKAYNHQMESMLKADKENKHYDRKFEQEELIPALKKKIQRLEKCINLNQKQK